MHLKKLLLPVFVMVIGSCLLSCVDENVASTDTERMEETVTATENTGVSEGQYEQPTLYFNDYLYQYNYQGMQTTIANRYIIIGTIEGVDLSTLPTENFNASGVDLQVGQDIYAEDVEHPNIIYVDLGGTYMPLILKKSD